MTQASRCWCGNTDLVPFSPEYARCSVCETLVTLRMPDADIALVKDDDRDFYGREYWFSHQEQDLGFTNITERARADLSERALHWLRALLKYTLPPGRTLELGSAHGGFVALMQSAGFDATGLELSPWVVEFAHRTFDVPMLLGKLEDQQIAPGSLDAIALMDVLEHLPDPEGTMRRCLELLKPTGLLLIQTPRYVEGRTYETLVSKADPFLEQLKAIQHLYLFSHRSVQELFHRLGADHAVFEPAIFAHYDMFLVVSRAPLAAHTNEDVSAALTRSPGGRLVLALLDLDERYRDARVRIPAIEAQLSASEADRAARLTLIERMGSDLGRIPQLEAQLAASEADRADRLEVIQRQGAEVARLRVDVARLQGRLGAVRRLIGSRRAEALAGLLRPGQWGEVVDALHGADPDVTRPDAAPGTRSLEAYSAEITRINRAQSNAPLLDAIRAYNHTMIGALDQSCPLRGMRVLDIGASPHGYALERALQLRAAEYVGIGLDVREPVEVRAPHGVGRLLAMNAEHLDLPDSSFDLVFSISTFEHVSDVPKVLAEIGRVLKPGGSALVSFEPIWTCSYGHHLHHFGPVSKLMPDWGHLVWDKGQMLSELAGVWPGDAPLSLEEAAHWVYESDAINRVPIGRMREHFAACALGTVWMTPMPDEARDPERLRDVSARLSLSRDDLMTKGLSVLLKKP